MEVWENTSPSKGTNYLCGYCGTNTSPAQKYTLVTNRGQYRVILANVFICTGCNKPTYKSDFEQVPGPIIGRDIDHLPANIEQLYNESRKCISVGAYTSSVLACRKLLMNIAVQEGAPEDRRFIQYIDFLEENGYIPPKGRAWADKIRTKGNEATHEIRSMSQVEAVELLSFIEMLLIFIYEFPLSIE